MFEIYYRTNGGEEQNFFGYPDTDIPTRAEAERRLAYWQGEYPEGNSYGHVFYIRELTGEAIEEKRIAQLHRLHRDLPDDLLPDWLDADWYGPLADIHFAELRDVDGVAMVAFYENERKRDARTQTTMRIGRYIRRFAKKGEAEPVYRDEEIERLVAAHDVKLQGSRVKITQDADEIEEIYVNGPHSCMSDGGWDVHPTRIYAGPDLGVAYLGDLDDASARAVVWPERKLYAPPYGDCSRLELMLKGMGYTKGRAAEWTGARMRRIEGNGGIVAPYIDFTSHVADEGDYLVVGGSGDHIETSNTNGCGRDGRTVCERCSGRVDDDETTTVYVAEDDAETWCDYCADHYSNRCEHSDENVRDRNTTSVETDSGTVEVADWHLADFGAVELDGTWYGPDMVATNPLTNLPMLAADLPELERQIAAAAEAMTAKGFPAGHPRNLPPSTLSEAEGAGQMALDFTRQGGALRRDLPLFVETPEGVFEAEFLSDDGSGYLPVNLRVNLPTGFREVWFNRDGSTEGCTVVGYRAFNRAEPAAQPANDSGLDLSRPIEAVHKETGQVVPMTLRGMGVWGRDDGFRTTSSPCGSSNQFWHDDGRDYVPTSQWFIRNAIDALAFAA